MLEQTICRQAPTPADEKSVVEMVEEIDLPDVVSLLSLAHHCDPGGPGPISA